MRKAGVSFIFVLLVFRTGLQCYGQLSDMTCKKVNTMLKVLDEHHYHPVELNNVLVKRIIHDYYLKLDEDQLYFTNEDRDNLYRECVLQNQRVEDQLCQYIRLSSMLFKERLFWVDSLLKTYENASFDFSVKESITLSGNDSIIHVSNITDLEKRWRKWIKYRTLVELFADSDSGMLSDINALKAAEPDMQKKTLTREHCKILKLLSYKNDLENYTASVFLNAVTSVYDPHTSYFSVEDKSDFETSLSKKYLTFGINLDESPSGEIQITGLVPGGPAWKSNELNKGDALIKIKLSDGQIINLSCLGVSGVNSLLESSRTEFVEFTVRKINGQMRTVKLRKEEMEVDDNIINSFVLRGEKKIGYICLPAFYTEYEQNTLLGCANDLAKEILKLSREKIDGLILDLRNNGGGSMTEALELAGIFINEGPLSIYRHRGDHYQVLKDINRGTIYDGPLILLVNKFSASASEILAAALQDYNRALIVGAPTFGKATGQIVMPMDEDYDPDNAAAKKACSDMGYLKLTVSRLYRVDGKTHQNTGVIPDIILPDEFGYVNFSEGSYASAYPADSIPKKTSFKALGKLPVKELAGKSKIRTDNDSAFREVNRINDLVKNYLDNSNNVPLDIGSFKSRIEKRSEIINEISHAGSHYSTLYSVDNDLYDKDLMQLDGYKKELNFMLLDDLQKDVYIEECYRILNDLIKFMDK